MSQQIWSYTHWHHQFFTCIWGYARRPLPTLFSYCATPDQLVAAGSHTLCTGIPAYANRNRILMRLIALFPLLCTTSGNVLFGGVWETLWIFKVARWKHDRGTKINKSPNGSNGVRKSPNSVCTVYKYRKYASKAIKVLSCNASKSNLEYSVRKAEKLPNLLTLFTIFFVLFSLKLHTPLAQVKDQMQKKTYHMGLTRLCTWLCCRCCCFGCFFVVVVVVLGFAKTWAHF